MAKLYSGVVVFALSFSPAFLESAEGKTDSDSSLTFENHIRPILKAYCFECHGEGPRLRGSLDLRLVRFARAGGDTRPAVVPGNEAKSLLLERLRKKEMPPGKVKLEKHQIELIASWIKQGANTAQPEPKKIGKGIYITPEERNYWAFQPIRRPMVPTVKNTKLVRNPIDAFLLRKLEQKGLSFSPEADRITLLRRVYFDLIGLPPSPHEVKAFLNEAKAKPRAALDNVIDRLLASPHYGERWGRHWLDAAGYADSEGYSNEDPIRPYAYKYRDYVIRAFNADMPIDRFIREQLAGDEMIRPNRKNLTPAETEKLIATGFLRMAPDGTGSPGVNQPVARNQVVADTIEIVSSSLLGLTVGCARCHNHKYDPISQVDYYRMRAIFEPALDWKNWRSPNSRRVVLFSDAQRKKAAAIESKAKEIDRARLKRQTELVQKVYQRELAKVPANMRDEVRSAKETPVAKRTSAQKKLLRKHPRVDIRVSQLRLYDRRAYDELQKFVVKANKLRATKPTPDYVRALTEIPGKAPVTRLFDRGEHEQPKQALTPAGLTVLQSHEMTEIPANDNALSTTGRRLAFARRLTSGKHPLVARALVNRVWSHHFGKGLVATPGNFGKLGDAPSHPELLDWLADEFVKKGWRLKRLHKLLLTSTAYRQSSRQRSELRKIDSENRLLGRMPLRRLEAEIVRDAILSVAGKLNRRQFGKPVPVTLDENGQAIIGVDTRDGAGRFSGKKVALGGEEFRRSVYVQVRRSQPLAVLDSFDSPVMSPNCHARSASTVAPQALLLMNSRFIHTFSEHFANRIAKQSGGNLHAEIRLAWQLAYSSAPPALEVEAAANFLRAQSNTFQRKAKTAPATARRRALAAFCQALLSSNRFLYVD